MVLLAQFDYQGTTMLDYTGNLFDPLVYGDPTQSTYQCAPELGITASCPGFPYAFPLVGTSFRFGPAAGRRWPTARCHHDRRHRR